MSNLALAGVLENEGVDVDIVLPVHLENFMSGMPGNIRAYNLLGLTSTSFNWASTKNAIKHIKNIMPHLKIVIGGPHPTAYPNYCLETTEADIACNGEGETTILEIIKTLSVSGDLSNVNGISYKAPDGVIHKNKPRPWLTEEEYQKLPNPAYHKLPKNFYSFFPVETSRGCPFNCIFCASPYKKSFRKKSIYQVDNAVRAAVNASPDIAAKNIFFAEDSFSVNAKHTSDVFTGYKRI